MKDLLKMNRHKPCIGLCSSQLINTNYSMHLNNRMYNENPIIHSNNEISTHHSSHSRREGVEETSEEEVEVRIWQRKMSSYVL